MTGDRAHAPVGLRCVVIGSGRSGTAWAARHLTRRGIVCGHESVFDWHPSSQPDRRLDYDGRTPSKHEPPAGIELQADASLAAIAHLAQLPAGCSVWHLARDPLDVIASWAAGGILNEQVPSTPYGRFIAAHVPEVFDEGTPVGRAARWVAAWNLRGRQAALVLGLPYRLTRIEAVSAGEAAVNASTHRRVTLGDVHAHARAETAAMLDVWRHAAGYVT